MAERAVIRKLEISRFRGIESLTWLPQAGMNIILGGGDVGKTTVLDAIALLLSPTNGATVSETDYWNRDTSADFTIEGIFALEGTPEISTQSTFAWPWHWDGEYAVQPAAPKDGSDDMPAAGNPVYRLRVRGTPDLELAWEIIQPGGETDHFSVAVRKEIGLVRLSADDRSDRDLRLVYGSALDRMLADSALRSRIGRQVAGLDLHQALGPEGASKLKDLGEKLEAAALPGALSLGLTSSQGLSIGALIGLLSDKNGISLPLASWGAGTRRMAALEIAALPERDASITTIDEIERGLEPYRLRKLIRDLLALQGQHFVTTHSPVAIACSTEATLWYLGDQGCPGALPRDKIRQQQRRDPETFLARMPVIAEGDTEIGFLTYLLSKAFVGDPRDYGVRVCNGQGNEATLDLLECLHKAGLRFGGIADDEGLSKGRWKKLKDGLGPRLLQWEGGCTEEVVIANIADADLEKLFESSDGDTGPRMRTVADRLAISDKSLASILEALTQQQRTLRELIVAAATGDPAGAPDGDKKTWQAHGKVWFKTQRGGYELAEKMVATGALGAIEPLVLPLVNSILASVGQPELSELRHE